MSTTGWIVLGVIVVLVLWIIMIYNGSLPCGSGSTRPSPTSTCSSSSATTSSPTWSRR